MVDSAPDNEYLDKLKALGLSKSSQVAIEFCCRHRDRNPSDFSELVDNADFHSSNIGRAMRNLIKRINYKVEQEKSSFTIENWLKTSQDLQSPFIEERIWPGGSEVLPGIKVSSSQLSMEMGRQNYLYECGRVIVAAVDFYTNSKAFSHNRFATEEIPLSQAEQTMENLRLNSFLQCEIDR